MKPPAFEYARPTSLADAVSALAESAGEGKVLAGGQSLVPLLNFRLASPRLLIDLNRVSELGLLSVESDALRIGAMTRMRTLETDARVAAAFPLLSAAAHWVGHVQIRNRGTVGGSLAHADPAAEIPAVALLADGVMTAVGPAGTRDIPADEFFQDMLFTSLGENEVLSEVRLPLPPQGSRWGFREFAHRRGDFALAGAAVTLPAVGTSAGGARVVVFGTYDRPRRSRDAEAALDAANSTGTSFAEAARAAAAEVGVGDPRPDAAFRRQVTETVVRRALEDAAARGVAREVNA